jgi:hypothetical protein
MIARNQLEDWTITMGSKVEIYIFRGEAVTYLIKRLPLFRFSFYFVYSQSLLEYNEFHDSRKRIGTRLMDQLEQMLNGSLT